MDCSCPWKARGDERLPGPGLRGLAQGTRYVSLQPLLPDWAEARTSRTSEKPFCRARRHKGWSDNGFWSRWVELMLFQAAALLALVAGVIIELPEGSRVGFAAKIRERGRYVMPVMFGTGRRTRSVV